MIATTATAIASVAKPFVEPFVKKFVTSKLQDFAKWCKEKGKEIATPKSEYFKAYLERMYDKCNTVKTLAFANSQLKLKDVYIPLTLKKDGWWGDITDSVIYGVPKKMIKKYKKILITDTAGMGKTTVMKRIFIAMIDDVEENIGIPIYIELNKLHEGHLIVDEIKEGFKELFETNDNELLLDLIRLGGFVFFLDGYDEIASDIDLVTNDIQDFISKSGRNNYFFLTSRPDARLNSFGDFQSFSIEPLKRNKAFELLKKYDLDENKERSNKLIATLNSEEYDSIEEYLGNPLLVSLLYTAYFYGKKIPLKKSQFYRQVYYALFEAHKLAQGVKPHNKHSLSDIDDFNSVLRYIGYECLLGIGVRFDEDTILASIDRAKAFYGNLEFGKSAFLKDLYTTVPLFVKEGTEYSWAHKSLMEYFAAQFIYSDAKENQDKILTAIYNSADESKYGNMLDIYYEIDYKGFSKNITLSLCEEYVKFYESVQIEAPMIDEESIDLRKSMLFFCDYQAELNHFCTLERDGSLLKGMYNKPFHSTKRRMIWTDFCCKLFKAKGRSSLNIERALIVKMRYEFYQELSSVLTRRKLGGGWMTEANQQKEIKSNSLGDKYIMVTMNNDGEVEKWILILNNGEIVVERTFINFRGSMNIDLHTGMKHPLFYTAFNLAMLNALDVHFYLDYYACKKEIESILGFLPKNSPNSIPLPS